MKELNTKVTIYLKDNLDQKTNAKRNIMQTVCQIIAYFPYRNNHIAITEK